MSSFDKKKKHCRFYQRWIDHNYYHDWNNLKPKVNVKPPKASLDVTDIMKLASGIVFGIVYKK